MVLILSLMLLFYQVGFQLHSCSTCMRSNYLKPNFLSLYIFLGEGFHNYHHTFPFDYATSEFGCKLNLTTAFIDFMCFLGLARDRKRVSKDTILARVQRTGDGSYKSGWRTQTESKKRFGRSSGCGDWVGMNIMLLIIHWASSRS